jgi:hypothetical protein
VKINLQIIWNYNELASYLFFKLKQQTTMKKTILFSLMLGLLVSIGFSSCKKTCTETNAPNFGSTSPCVDLTAGLVGTYVGTFADSAIGLAGDVTTGVTVNVTKLDDATVLFTPADTGFVAFTAKLTQSGNGCTLAVVSGTANGSAYSGLPYTGSSSVNGAFDSGSKQLATYITISEAGSSVLEVFVGTKQ